MNADFLAHGHTVSDHPISSRQTRILIAGDYTVVTTDLRQLLELVEGVAVVAETGWGEETLRLVENLKPDIVLLDLEMSSRSGQNSRMPRLIRQLKALLPSPSLFALTVHPQATALLEAHNAGADAVFVKGQDTDKLVDAIRNFCKR